MMTMIRSKQTLISEKMRSNQLNNRRRSISIHLSRLFKPVIPQTQSYHSKRKNLRRKLRRNLQRKSLIKKIKSLRSLRTRKGTAKISSLKITKHPTQSRLSAWYLSLSLSLFKFSFKDFSLKWKRK